MPPSPSESDVVGKPCEAERAGIKTHTIMNEQVQSFIEKAKVEQEATKLKERNQHLISLGLIDENKSERKYQEYFSENAKWDIEKKMYYVGLDVAVETTDEEYNEICKYFPPKPEKEVKVNFEGSGVKTLNGFGTFSFVIASIAMLVAVIGFIMYLANDMDYSSERENAIIGISMASSLFPIAIGSFAGGAICKGLSTIAKTALYKRTLLEKQYRFEE